MIVVSYSELRSIHIPEIALQASGSPSTCMPGSLISGVNSLSHK